MDTSNGQLTAYDVQSAARDVWHYVKNAFFDSLLLRNNARKKKKKGLSTEFVSRRVLLSAGEIPKLSHASAGP